MKIIYLFFFIFILIGCKSNYLNKSNSTIVECPLILFSKDHKNYIDTSFEKISMDNITYKAEINNAQFTKACEIKEGFFNGEISLLFLVKPNIQKKQIIDLPFYLAILDKKNKLIDINYYRVEDVLEKNVKHDSFVEKEIISSKQIKFKENLEYKFIIAGFLLDKKRLELID